MRSWVLRVQGKPIFGLQDNREWMKVETLIPSDDDIRFGLNVDFFRARDCRDLQLGVHF